MIYCINSLSPLKFEWRLTPLDLKYNKSTLVRVMALCRQATSHCLSQCWPRSLPPYGVTSPQWVNYCVVYWHTIKKESKPQFTWLSVKPPASLMHICLHVIAWVSGVMWHNKWASLSHWKCSFVVILRKWHRKWTDFQWLISPVR